MSSRVLGVSKQDMTGRATRRGPRAYLCIAASLCLFVACGPGGSPKDRNDLSAMDKARISIGEHTFETWLARKTEETQLGLMFVTAEELAPISDDNGGATLHRGMLFVFAYDHPLSFWMRNTITPLDIAYIRSDGLIVSTHTMAPLETRSYPSGEPAMYALEVLAGTFDDLGIAAGDHVEIPFTDLKASR